MGICPVLPTDVEIDKKSFYQGVFHYLMVENVVPFASQKKINISPNPGSYLLMIGSFWVIWESIKNLGICWYFAMCNMKINEECRY